MHFLVVGGDLRQYFMAKSLKASGHETEVFGLDKTDLAETTLDKIKKSTYDAVILPMPVSRDRINLNCQLNSFTITLEKLINSLNNTKIFGGIFDFGLLQTANQNILFDYARDESLLLENAKLTAEGAILTAISGTNHSLYNSDCLCVGYGRIGKCLSKALKAFGARVSVGARKTSDLNLISKNGMTQILTSQIDLHINKFDIIFNTVPTRVIGNDALKKCKSDATLIELASAPYGFDREFAGSLGLNTLLAQSLPGKYSPKTAGEIILKSVFKSL